MRLVVQWFHVNSARWWFGLLLLLCLLTGSLATSDGAASKPVLGVGSKSFTESYILGEIIAQIISRVGEARVERHLGLGGTGITYRALLHGNIDIYPEYTGTLSHAILKDPSAQAVEAIRRQLEPQGLTISEPLGFNNTYALAMRADVAARLGVQTISDLRRHPHLTAAFSSGFLERDDGWPGLRRHYGVTLANVRAMEHALTYEALAQGEVDIIDIFSTDGKLTKFDLRILRDDRHFFPSYYAVLFARQAFIERFPRTWEALRQTLVGQIDDRTMARLNAQADLHGESFQQVSGRFLEQEVDAMAVRWTMLRTLLTLTVEHVYLVTFALAIAIVVGVPLGIIAARLRRLGQVELMTIGILQTIPALALLCFMIPLFGIGKLPALVALLLYALLPIVRNTYTGIISLDRQLVDIAGVLGLSRWQRLRRIELPLASLSIMAGIKTSAIFTVGTATLAAFIGGGGYGTLIVRGLALDDIKTILAGAIPAALLALVMHGLFELVDRVVIPRGLQHELRHRS
jgi:osmoprotectant transport system permease protein